MSNKTKKYIQDKNKTNLFTHFFAAYGFLFFIFTTLALFIGKVNIILILLFTAISIFYTLIKK